jgi:transketolase
MSILLATDNVEERVAMRDAYVDELIELAEKDERILAVDADLMLAMGIKRFAEKYPDRAINCGVQEANMYGVSAGLSVMGFIPYAHTFACFASRRACDQIFISCAYAKLNVRVIGSDPGINAALNGGTHMPFEDLGIMRIIPGMTILEPTDSVMIRDIVRQTANLYGMFYIRLVRRYATKIYEEGSTFTIGKAVMLRDGKDITIIATGYCVAESLDAAKQLSEQGISARVLNMFTIKPIDCEAVVSAAEETGAIITAENHNIINGLGSAVAEVLGEHYPVPLERVGVQDEFGEVGPVDFLSRRFGLTADHIVAKAEKILRRKGMQIQV